MRLLLAAAAVLAAAPLAAQTPPPPGAAMSAEQVGAAPMTGTSPANYAAWAADSDLYEMQSSKLALSKSKNPEVRRFAQEMIADHTQTTRSLMAALPKTSPRVPKPPKALSADNAAMIAQLRAAPADGFDALYMQQQTMAHQKAWALHAGFAADGSDPALKQVATTAVPIIEKHIAHAKAGDGAMGAM